MTVLLLLSDIFDDYDIPFFSFVCAFSGLCVLVLIIIIIFYFCGEVLNSIYGDKMLWSTAQHSLTKEWRC